MLRSGVIAKKVGMTRLFMDGLKFMAEAEFTDLGIDAVTKRGFRYLSMDFTEEYEDPETEKKHGALLFGAGLTIRPRIKRLNATNRANPYRSLMAARWRLRILLRPQICRRR